MIIILLILWYVIGFVGNLLMIKRYYGQIVVIDIIVITLSSILGPLSLILLWLIHNGNKKIF